MPAVLADRPDMSLVVGRSGSYASRIAVPNICTTLHNAHQYATTSNVGTGGGREQGTTADPIGTRSPGGLTFTSQGAGVEGIAQRPRSGLHGQARGEKAPPFTVVNYRASRLPAPAPIRAAKPVRRLRATRRCAAFRWSPDSPNSLAKCCQRGRGAGSGAAVEVRFAQVWTLRNGQPL